MSSYGCATMPSSRTARRRQRPVDHIADAHAPDDWGVPQSAGRPRRKEDSDEQYAGNGRHRVGHRQHLTRWAGMTWFVVIGAVRHDAVIAVTSSMNPSNGSVNR